MRYSGPRCAENLHAGGFDLALSESDSLCYNKRTGRAELHTGGKWGEDMKKKPYIIIAILIVVVFSVLEAADYLSNPAPPKLQGQVLLSQVPVEVDLLVKQADSGMREATEKFHFEADGTVSAAEASYILTTGGLVTEQIYEQIMTMDSGFFTGYLGTDTGGVFAFQQREPTEQHYFTLYDWEEADGSVLEMQIPKRKNNPAIYAMQKDGNTLYLFDYDNYENASGIFITAVDERTGNLQYWELPWQAVAGPLAEDYPIRNLVLYSDEIAVYDKILYLIIPTLPQKYGIESTILAAYDLEAGRPIDFCILEKCQPLAFYLAGDRLYVLTNPYDWQTVELRSYHAKTMELVSTSSYQLPQAWTERVPREDPVYSFESAAVTDQWIFAVLPVHDWDKMENTADLVAYDRHSGALVWHGQVAINEMEYEIRHAIFSVL